MTNQVSVTDEEGMVEEIARVIAEADYNDPSKDVIAGYWDAARAILPLIIAAREQGARDMRERAAKASHKAIIEHCLKGEHQSAGDYSAAAYEAICALPVRGDAP